MTPLKPLVLAEGLPPVPWSAFTTSMNLVRDHSSSRVLNHHFAKVHIFGQKSLEDDGSGCNATWYWKTKTHPAIKQGSLIVRVRYTLIIICSLPAAATPARWDEFRDAILRPFGCIHVTKSQSNPSNPNVMKEALGRFLPPHMHSSQKIDASRWIGTCAYCSTELHARSYEGNNRKYIEFTKYFELGCGRPGFRAHWAALTSDATMPRFPYIVDLQALFDGLPSDETAKNLSSARYEVTRPGAWFIRPHERDTALDSRAVSDKTMALWNTQPPLWSPTEEVAPPYS